jgi:hypothetical protein
MKNKNRKKLIYILVGLFLLFGLFAVIQFLSPIDSWAADIPGEKKADDVDKSLAWAGWSHLGLGMVKIPLGLIMVLAYVIQFLTWLLVKVAFFLLSDYFFTPDFYSNVLGGFAINPVVISGWKIVAGLVNMFYIIILLIIGVGTLFRVEKYTYKKLLVKLVIAALLTNFSLVFAGIILDFAHIIMFSAFKNPMESFGQAIDTMLAKDIYKAADRINLMTKQEGIMQAISIAAGPVVGAIFLALIAITVCAIAFFLIVRVVVLWVLLVLSPFAYIGAVLPDTQKISSEWWSKFLANAFMGPLLFFFVWFAVSMLDNVFNLEGVSNTMSVHQESTFSHYLLSPGEEARNLTSSDSFAQVITDPVAEGIKEVEKDPIRETIRDGEGKATHPGMWLFLVFVVVLLWGALLLASRLGVMGASTAIRFGTVAISTIGGAIGITVMATPSAGLMGTSKASRWGKESSLDKGALYRTKLALAQKKLETTTDKDKRDRLNKQIAGYEKKIDSSDKWASRFEFLESGAKLAGAMNPLSIARAAATSYQSMKQAHTEETREALTKVGRIARGSFSGTILTKARTAMATEELSRLNERKRQENKKKTAEKNIQQLQPQKTALANQIQINEFERRRMIKDGEQKTPEYAMLLKNITKTKDQLKEVQTKLQEEKDIISQTSKTITEIDAEAPIKGQLGAAAAVVATPLQDALYFDRTEDVKVQEASKNIEHLTDTSALIRRYQTSLDSYEKEAITVKLAHKADLNDLLAAEGFDSDQLPELLSKHHGKRRAQLLGTKLDNLHQMSSNMTYTSSTSFDKITNQMKLELDPQKRAAGVAFATSNMTPVELLRNLRPENIFKIKADGSKELSDQLPYVLDAMKEGVLPEVKHLRDKTVPILRDLNTNQSKYGLTTENGYTEQQLRNLGNVIKARDALTHKYT